jgi:hypothetical protein
MRTSPLLVCRATRAVPLRQGTLDAPHPRARPPESAAQAPSVADQLNVKEAALKAASDPIKDLFYRNMSGRAAKILKEDMEALGAVRLKDVEEAQTALVTITKELANSGQIKLAEGEEDGELVY